MRLIDADALLKQHGIEAADKYTDEGLNRDALDTRALYEIKGMIDDAPTVDAVPVVRCKDCKWILSLGKELGCKRRYEFVDEGDYCVFGERKQQ